MPFSPPTIVTLRSVTWSARITTPPRTTAADERLCVVDDERPLHDPVQVHGWRPHRIGGAEAADHRQRDRRRRRDAGPAELAARLAVLEPQAWEQPPAEDLSARPAHAVDEERLAEGGGDVEDPHPAIDERQLERAERQREPRRLVGERAVVDGHVEHEAEREHQRDELDRPPAVQREREHQRGRRRREARLDAASQRVRHTRRRNARAAYFAPAIVSAAGNAH